MRDVVEPHCIHGHIGAGGERETQLGTNLARVRVTFLQSRIRLGCVHFQVARSVDGPSVRALTRKTVSVKTGAGSESDIR